MKRKKFPLSFPGRDGEIVLSRLENGAAEISASSLADALYGLGRMHFNDRQVQMVLTKLVLQGRLCEFIKDRTGHLFGTDIYIRRLLLFPDRDEQIKRINSRTMLMLQSYVAGINDCLLEKGRVWELKVSGIEIEPWTVADVIHMGKVFSYFGLVDAQGSMEKFIVQMIKNGIDLPRLKELFTSIEDDIDFSLLGKVTLEEPPVDETLEWLSKIPRFRASNNWAVSGKRTVSGFPILAGDPHLEVNRMPAIWYDSVIRIPGNTISGFSMPGMPAVLLGRTDYISYSPTYSFADMIDYRVEECSGGKFRRGAKWVPFDVHREMIRFRSGETRTVEVYENEHGVLEGDPFTDGYYLVRSWSAGRDCGAADLNAAIDIMEAKSVREAMRIYRGMEAPSFCFVIADTSGNIGFQMTGRVFRRPKGVSGLVPTPAWERKYSPRGFVDPARMPSQYNPECGYIITANNDLNHLGGANPINLSCAEYRYRRIESIIRGRKGLDVEVMKDIQYDLHSMQAQEIISSLKHLIPDCENGRRLKSWDFRYASDSEGAAVFENLYESLVKVIFGTGGLGEDTVEYMLKETSLFSDYFAVFDSVLLAEKSFWFRRGNGEDLRKMAIDRALSMPVKKYGDTRKIVFRHLLFGGKIPSFFGFDHGPVMLPGGRATILQGQIFRSMGRVTTFSPSARIVADMATGILHENMPGGTTDRRFSRLYRNSMDSWYRGDYRELS